MMLNIRQTSIALLVVFSVFGMFIPSTLAQTMESSRAYIEAEKDGESVFIEHNPKSNYYNNLSEFAINEFDLDFYHLSVDYLKANKLSSKHVDLLGLPKQWVLIRYYKNQFINYHPCDFMNFYQASFKDNMFLDYTGEGVFANQISKFKTINTYTYTMQLNSLNQVTQDGDYPRTLNIYILDRSAGVAAFEFVGQSQEPTRYLMVDVEKIRLHPILVKECRYNKALEFDTGDSPTIVELIQQSKLIGKHKKH